MDVVETQHSRTLQRPSGSQNRNTVTTEQMEFAQKLINNTLAEIEKVNYYSNDPYDLFESGPIRYLRKHKSSALSSITEKAPTAKQRLIRAVLSPLYQSTLVMRLYRGVCRIKRVQHPKTMGLLLQGLCAQYRTEQKPAHMLKAKNRADWLTKNTDEHRLGHYCWGLPWEWLSEVNIPRFGAQSTISAVNSLGMIDLFDITQDKKYLDVAQSTCEFYLEHLNIDKISSDKWAVSYTPYDNTHIINVNFHCAALLIKVWERTGIENYLTVAIKLCNFSIAEQRKDGAWNYSASIDGYVNAVDNTHTGDNLEYLYLIKQSLKDEFPYQTAYEKGISYYVENFISEDGMPYYTDKEKYPVESHSSCQMLITLSMLSNDDKTLLPIAYKLMKWLSENMMNKAQNRMFYRRYESGRTDRTYSISWGDSWLVKGASLWLESARDVS